MKNVPVVILAGGLGTRLREQTEFMPKALVKVGPYPIIVHIMSIYAHHGFNDFIIALGYKGDMIKQYFLNYRYYLEDFSLRLKDEVVQFYGKPVLNDIEIKFVETGPTTDTGGRIKLVEKYIDSEVFLCNYTDGVSNVNINELVASHNKKKKIATLTAVHQYSQYGVLDVQDSMVKTFKEKPILPGYINGGYYVFNRKIFDYLTVESRLEDKPLETIASQNQLAAYIHDGFWASMDTQKDVDRLNSVWESKNVPWKVW